MQNLQAVLFKKPDGALSALWKFNFLPGTIQPNLTKFECCNTSRESFDRKLGLCKTVLHFTYHLDLPLIFFLQQRQQQVNFCAVEMMASTPVHRLEQCNRYI